MIKYKHIEKIKDDTYKIITISFNGGIAYVDVNGNFNPDIIFPNHTKENIKLIERYKEYKPNEGNMSPDCQELYFVLNKIKHSDNLHDYDYFYSIYSSFDKSKILEEKYLYKQHDPKLFK